MSEIDRELAISRMKALLKTSPVVDSAFVTSCGTVRFHLTNGNEIEIDLKDMVKSYQENW
jgi:hypothetical protein